MTTSAVTHTFVEFIPDRLDDNIIYVSVTYSTVVHKCFCGCGKEVVTPLSPTDWKLTFDGKTISLHPSIGSWNLKCQSHYWIRRDTVEWMPKWGSKQIESERARDQEAKAGYFDEPERPQLTQPKLVASSLWNKVKRWWS